MKDNAKELLPVVDAEGNVIGQTTRGTAHNGIDKPLHPVVHLHVFNPQGELFLQHRPVWKDIQPDRWDTAVGGHVDWGEDIPTALRREVREEIGIELSEGLEEVSALTRYVFESAREHELVNVFCLVTTEQPRPTAELDGGRFFSPEEIAERIGTAFFTPNFEQEYQRVFVKK
ncbi:MAG: NUDIX domain-containing protein [Bacteroidales bacterium]|nr:NUDIX domain-containing protein [Bacteroidales bacterium]